MTTTENLKYKLLEMLNNPEGKDIDDKDRAFLLGSEFMQLELYAEEDHISLREVLTQLINTRFSLLADMMMSTNFKDSLHYGAVLSVWLESRGVLAVPVAKGWNKVKLWLALGRAVLDFRS